MSRDEKTKLMKRKILNAAIKEFGEYGYTKTSMNNICKHAGISKGIIYHYFQDKDDLYLTCVKICYQTLLEYYVEHSRHMNGDIDAYMYIRMNFFKEYKYLRGLFFQVLLNTPIQLQEEIERLKQPLTEFHHDIYLQNLSKLNLRTHMTTEKAIQYIDIMQNAYNDYFRKELDKSDNFEEVIKNHEEFISQWVDYMIYGIARKCNK